MRQRYLKTMSSIVPIGAVGASLLLGSMLPVSAAERPVPPGPVSERLTAIREAVLAVVGPGEISKLQHRNLHLTWGNRWNNWGRHRWGWGWGPPRWNNWRNGWPNWNNFWRNW